MKKTFLILVVIMLQCNVSVAQLTFTNANGNGKYGEDGNWDGGYAPDPFTQVIFDGNATTADCIITDAQVGGWFEIGTGPVPYGTVIIKNGGKLEGKVGHWSAVGWTQEATLLVEAGGIFSCGEHLWLGFNPGVKSHVKIYGTVNVKQMFGMNFENNNNTGSADVTVYNGGLLNLNEFHHEGRSIQGTNMILKVMGGGKVVMNWDRTAILATHIAADQIVAPGGSVQVAYDPVTDKTTITSNATPISLTNKDFSTSGNFNVYPNPTQNYVNIKSESPISDLKVYSISGQLLLHKKGMSSVDLSGLSNGAYLVHSEDNSGKVEVTKVVKN